MNIQGMIELALQTGQAEHGPYVVKAHAELLAVYKDNQLRLLIDKTMVTAFQAWTRNDTMLLNAVFAYLQLPRLHCTWSENGAHLIEYDAMGEVLHAETPVELIRRLNNVITT